MWSQSKKISISWESKQNKKSNVTNAANVEYFELYFQLYSNRSYRKRKDSYN